MSYPHDYVIIIEDSATVKGPHIAIIHLDKYCNKKGADEHAEFLKARLPESCKVAVYNDY